MNDQNTLFQSNEAPIPQLRVTKVNGCPSVRFHNVDCMEFMKDVPDNFYELAIVDPPYGINLADWDKETPNQQYFDELRRVSVNQIIFGGNYFVDKLPITEAWVCWSKKPFLKQQAHFELAWTSFDMKPRLIEYTYAGNAEGMNKVKVDYKKKSIHPAQKPENIYTLFLREFAQKGMKILDTHGGSMSIAIACDMEGFDLDICENDPVHFKNGVERFQQYKSQKRLF